MRSRTRTAPAVARAVKNSASGQDRKGAPWIRVDKGACHTEGLGLSDSCDSALTSTGGVGVWKAFHSGAAEVERFRWAGCATRVKLEHGSRRLQVHTHGGAVVVTGAGMH